MESEWHLGIARSDDQPEPQLSSSSLRGVFPGTSSAGLIPSAPALKTEGNALHTDYFYSGDESEWVQPGLRFDVHDPEDTLVEVKRESTANAYGGQMLSAERSGVTVLPLGAFSSSAEPCKRENCTLWSDRSGWCSQSSGSKPTLPMLTGIHITPQNNHERAPETDVALNPVVLSGGPPPMCSKPPALKTEDAQDWTKTGRAKIEPSLTSTLVHQISALLCSLESQATTSAQVDIETIHKLLRCAGDLPEAVRHLVCAYERPDVLKRMEHRRFFLEIEPGKRRQRGHAYSISNGNEPQLDKWMNAGGKRGVVKLRTTSKTIVHRRAGRIDPRSDGLQCNPPTTSLRYFQYSIPPASLTATSSVSRKAVVFHVFDKERRPKQVMQQCQLPTSFNILSTAGRTQKRRRIV